MFETTNSKVERWFTLILTIWALSVGVIGYMGLFRGLYLPLLALMVAIGVIIPTIIYLKSPQFRNYIVSIPLKHLTLFHLWRIPAGFAFLYYGSQNLLPQAFVNNAGYGDLAVGFLVPIIFMLKESKLKYKAFHVFGILDFIIAVGTGLTFSILQVPAMENILEYPIILIPLFGVPVTGSLSLMVLHRLYIIEKSFNSEKSKVDMKLSKEA